jgi:hypothetical protein
MVLVRGRTAVYLEARNARHPVSSAGTPETLLMRGKRHGCRKGQRETQKPPRLARVAPEIGEDLPATPPLPSPTFIRFIRERSHSARPCNAGGLSLASFLT